MATNSTRVGAVHYLNTVPLVWGMLHGQQQSDAVLSFSSPADCASAMAAGEIDVGLLPVAEIARQGLQITADVGIACRGSVRSILLATRKPIRQIESVAVDRNSRTSVELARVLLREQHGIQPPMRAYAPDLRRMLAQADAALVIGDAALRIDPAIESDLEFLDLGQEWWSLTGLPMVFAAWARSQSFATECSRMLGESYDYGRRHLAEIVDIESKHRGLKSALVATYLTENIKFELGKAELEGLQAFYELSNLVGVAAE